MLPETLIRRPARSIALLGVAILASIAPGCASSPRAEVDEARRKLARVGIEVLEEDQAGIPPAERGRYLPCRTIPGFPRPVLEPHPAGYLLLGLAGGPPGTGPLLGALASWRKGDPLRVTVRRNPWLQPEPGWWEAEVEMRLP